MKNTVISKFVFVLLKASAYSISNKFRCLDGQLFIYFVRNQTTSRGKMGK